MVTDRAIRIEHLVTAPRSVVWDDLATLSAHGEWMVDAAEVSVHGDGAPGVGTRIEVLTRVGPLRTTDRMVITEWVPPRRMAVEHRGLVGGVGVFTLDDRGESTLLQWSEQLRFPWRLGGPVGALVARPVLAALWRGNLRRFAARFE